MEPIATPGTIRHDPANNLVAMRTALPDPRSWFIGTVGDGGHYDGDAAVEGWATLYRPAE